MVARGSADGVVLLTMRQLGSRLLTDDFGVPGDWSQLLADGRCRFVVAQKPGRSYGNAGTHEQRVGVAAPFVRNAQRDCYPQPAGHTPTDVNVVRTHPPPEYPGPTPTCSHHPTQQPFPHLPPLSPTHRGKII